MPNLSTLSGKTAEGTTLTAEEIESARVEAEEAKVQGAIRTLLHAPNDKEAIGTLRGKNKKEVQEALTAHVSDETERKRILALLEGKKEEGIKGVTSILMNKDRKSWSSLLREEKEVFLSLPPDEMLVALSKDPEAGKLKGKYFSILQNLPTSKAFPLAEMLFAETSMSQDLTKAEKGKLLFWRQSVMTAHGSLLLKNVSEIQRGRLLDTGATRTLIQEQGADITSDEIAKEAEMLRIVRATLGEGVAGRAETVVRENHAETFAQKMQRVSSLIQTEHMARMQQFMHEDLPTVIAKLQGILGESDAYFTGMLGFLPTGGNFLSPQEKQEMIRRFREKYAGLRNTLSVLGKSTSERNYFEGLCNLKHFTKEEDTMGSLILERKESLLREATEISSQFHLSRLNFYQEMRQLVLSGVIVRKPDGIGYEIAEGRAQTFTTEYVRIAHSLGVSPDDLRTCILTDDSFEPSMMGAVGQFEKRNNMGTGEASSLIKNPQPENILLLREDLQRLVGEKPLPQKLTQFFIDGNPRNSFAIRAVEGYLAELSSVENDVIGHIDAFGGREVDEKKVLGKVNELIDPRSIEQDRGILSEQFSAIEQAFQKICLRLGNSPLLAGAQSVLAMTQREIQNLSTPITLESITEASQGIQRLFSRIRAADGGNFYNSTLESIGQGVAFTLPELTQQVENAKTVAERIANASEGDFPTLAALHIPQPSTRALDTSGLNTVREDAERRERETLLSIYEDLRNYRIPADERGARISQLFQCTNSLGQPLFHIATDEETRAAKESGNSSNGFFYNQKTQQISVPRLDYEALLRGEINDALHPLLHEITHHFIQQTRGSANSVGQLIDLLKKTGQYEEAMLKMKDIYRDKTKRVDGKELPLSEEDLSEELLAMMIARGQIGDEMSLIQKLEEEKKKLKEGRDAISANMGNAFLEGRSKNIPSRTNEPMAIMGSSTGTETPRNVEAIEKMTPDRYNEAKLDVLQAWKPIEDKLDVLTKTSKASNKNEAVQQARGIFARDLADFDAERTEKKFKELMTRYDIQNSDFSGKIDEWLSQSSEMGEDDAPNIFLDLYRKTTFLSMKDMKSMWGFFTAYIGRRHERNSKKRAGNAGEAIASPFSRGLASEFSKEVEAAEQGEVSKLKDALKNKDAWDLQSILGKSRNKDEIKAILYLLSDAGRLDWRDERIWRALERQHCGVTFYESDKYNMNVLKTKLQKACTIWDNDFFRGINNANDGAFENNVKKYDNEGNLNISRLGGILQDMLNEHVEKGKDSRVDPHRYLSFVLKTQTAGKGNPMDPIYYAIMGVAEGLIPQEYLLRLNSSQLNAYPLWEFFTKGDPSQKQFELWRDDILKEKKKKSNGKCENYNRPESFSDWVYANVHTQQNVEQRILANFSGIEWDHDYVRVLGAMGNSSGAKNLTALGGPGGQTRFKPTMYNSATVGALQFLTSMGRQSERVPPEMLRKVLTRQLGYSFTLNGILQNRLATQEKKYRFSEDEKNAPPREAYSYVKGATTQWYMNESENIYINAIKNMGSEAKPLVDLLLELRKGGNNTKVFDGEVGRIINNDFGVIIQKRGLPKPNNLEDVYDLLSEFFAYYLDPDPTTGVGSASERNMETFLSVIKETNKGHMQKAGRDIGKEDAKTKELDQQYATELLPKAA